MEYRNLGRTGAKVSPLALGTMMLGAWGNRDRAECLRIVHRALDAGINLVDTANVYAAGESEEIVGEAIRGRREDVFLATKCWGSTGPGPFRRGLSRKAVQQACEASLRRLGTDGSDLYFIHRPDPETRWEETLAALPDLVRQGTVRYLGASTNHWETPGQKVLSAWELVETLWISERSGFERFVSLQPPYSILRRSVERDHFPATKRHGIGNLTWSPLEGGWLTGRYRRGGENPKDSPRAAAWMGETGDSRFRARLDAVEALVPLAAARGVPLADLALAWVLRNRDVTSVIVGPRTEAQLEASLSVLESGLDARLSREELATIDRLVPPGGSVL